MPGGSCISRHLSKQVDGRHISTLSHSQIEQATVHCQIHADPIPLLYGLVGANYAAEELLFRTQLLTKIQSHHCTAVWFLFSLSLNDSCGQLIVPARTIDPTRVRKFTGKHFDKGGKEQWSIKMAVKLFKLNSGYNYGTISGWKWVLLNHKQSWLPKQTTTIAPMPYPFYDNFKESSWRQQLLVTMYMYFWTKRVLHSCTKLRI